MPRSSDEVLILEAGRAERHYWRDLWRYRELFWVLAWRDVSVRYKQTVLGFAWALRPLLTMSIFTLVFHKFANLPSDGQVPYALMVFAGLLPWTFFGMALSDASNSLVASAHLIGKIYFPRLIVPVAAVVVAFVDFLISLVILFGLMVWFAYPPDWRIVTLPAFAALAFLASLGPGLWLSALNVRYRDFRFIVPFVVQFGLYISPVGFSSSVVPDRWRLIYAVNPIVGIIDGCRWSILRGTTPIYLPGLAMSVAVTAALLYLGFTRFRRTEMTFADLI